LQLSGACRARPLVVAREDKVIDEVMRVAEGVMNSEARDKRRDFYRQVGEHLMRDDPHHRILTELLRWLGTAEDPGKEASLLLDAFGSIREIVLQPLSTLLTDCPVEGTTAHALHAFLNERPSQPQPCALCRGEDDGCLLLSPSPSQHLPS
ncbi:unnamed protein product, partial [Choristocarpus tenellus]